MNINPFHIIVHVVSQLGSSLVKTHVSRYHSQAVFIQVFLNKFPKQISSRDRYLINIYSVPSALSAFLGCTKVPSLGFLSDSPFLNPQWSGVPHKSKEKLLVCPRGPEIRMSVTGDSWQPDLGASHPLQATIGFLIVKKWAWGYSSDQIGQVSAFKSLHLWKRQ